MRRSRPTPFESVDSFLFAIAKPKAKAGMAKWMVAVFFMLAGLQTAAQVPVADFTANAVTGCSPLSVTFQDRSTNNPTSWNWDFGNGQLSNQQNPVAVYGSPGRYTVQLVVRNADGTNGITKTDFIVVNPSPSVFLSANITTGCLPSTIQFTDETNPGAGVATSWFWDFGDGTTSTQQNPLKTYNTVGFYSIFLRVTSSSGCTNSGIRANYIRIVPGVTAQFDNSKPITCRPPFATDFSNLTSGPGNLTFTWDFGDGTGSTQTNPSVSYGAAGTYNVSLTATSEFGCSGSIQKPVTIEGDSTAITGPDNICLNTTGIFSNSSNPSPISTLWDFGNGILSNKLTDTILYTTPGTYTVKLFSTFNTCTDSAFKTVVVTDSPAVNFTGTNLVACKAPLTTNFQDNSIGAVGWLWDFGDGTTSTEKDPSHTYTTLGTYNVTLTITTSGGCQNTQTKKDFIQISKPGSRIFNLPVGRCIGVPYSPAVTFGAIDGVKSTFWDFGDGFTTTIARPTHIYTDSGTYTLRFIVTSNGGCSDSQVVKNAVRVGPEPTIDFNILTSDTCASAKVSFVDLSHPTDQWFWEFGDGDTSSLQNPVHAYKDSGFFNVTLSGFNNGCKKSLTKDSIIHVKPPVAAFIYTIPACTDKRTVAFINQSKVDPAYGPISYFWEFGDPANTTYSNPSNTDPPPFTYPTIGVYKAVLTATNGACTSTDTVRVQLLSDVADFKVSKSTTLCKGDTMTLTVINSLPQNVLKYEWSTDGGVTYMDSTRTIKILLPDTGTYNVVLRMTDANNCVSTKTIPVRVNGPTASFTTATGGACGDKTTTFIDQSTPVATITKWTWDFGDGQIRNFNNAPFTHTYTDTGSFVVKLTVTDNGGCISSYTLPSAFIVTSPKIAFSANYTTVCPQIDVQFKDSSRGNNLTYSWDFGDGTVSALANPVHSYPKADKQYTVKFTIRDITGCVDSLVRINYITVKSPKAAFDIKDTTTMCPPIETKFTFKGTDYESFYWDFGDSTSSTLQNPTHFYNSYGQYTPKLFLVGGGGCLDSAVASVNVYNPYDITKLNYSPLTSCNELLVNFNLIIPPSTTFKFWYADGVIDSSQAIQFQHFYNSPGFYNPFVMLKDNQNCPVTIGGPTTIRIIGANPFFGVSKKSFCDSGTVIFTNYTIGNDPVVSRTWDFGDNTSVPGVTDPTHSYGRPGTFVVGQTVTTQSGCSKTITDTIRVYGTPHPIIDADSIACINDAKAFRGNLVTPDTSITWLWDFGNGVGSSLQNAVATYTKEGTYSVNLKTSNKLGCFDTTSKKIFVPPLPVVTIPENPVIPVATGTPLPVTYGPNIAAYAWTPAANLSCTNCAFPFASPRQNTTYTVTVTDIYGCKASADILVSVVCNEKNFYLPNTFSPNGDGVNDIFTPRGIGLARVASMRIFNRWGELVFEKKNFMANDRSPAGGWDGTYKGKPASPDVYVYFVEFVCENSAIIPYRGNVTLIR